jgi:membrane protease YdiL (CAAX protease family)
MLAAAGVCWMGWRQRGGALEATYSLRPVPLQMLVAVTVTVLGLSVVLSEADNVMQRFLPTPDWLSEIFERMISGAGSRWGAVFALVVAAPLAEEPIFRGLMLRGFLSRYSPRTAIVTSALLFGAAHLNPWQFVGASVFGVVAGWWVLRSGSLVPALWGHAVENGLPSLTQALGFVIPGYSGRSDVVLFQPLWFDAAGVWLLGIGLWLTRRAMDRVTT